MKIKIVCVGKIKEAYLDDAILEYKKRISKYSNIEICEVKDESNQLDEKKVLELEAERIIPNLEGYVIGLVIKGNMLDSIELAKKIDEVSTYNNSTITFVIGGSYGLSNKVIEKMNYKLSFSKMTFPHQLMRVILLEQVYRAFKINNNETYHK